MKDPEVSEFIVSRLIELLVAVLNDHVEGDGEATKARTDARLALTVLGEWAAQNGRADLMPCLCEAASKIQDVRVEREPQFFESARTGQKAERGWRRRLTISAVSP